MKFKTVFVITTNKIVTRIPVTIEAKDVYEARQECHKYGRQLGRLTTFDTLSYQEPVLEEDFKNVE